MLVYQRVAEVVLDYELFDPGFIGKGVTWYRYFQCEHFFQRNQG